MKGILSLESVLDVGSLAPGTKGGLGTIYTHHALPGAGAVLVQAKVYSTSAVLFLLWPSAPGLGISSPWVSFYFFSLFFFFSCPFLFQFYITERQFRNTESPMTQAECAQEALWL